jgi:hypothetical protein
LQKCWIFTSVLLFELISECIVKTDTSSSIDNLSGEC